MGLAPYGNPIYADLIKEKVVEIQEKLDVAEIKLDNLSFYIKQLERLLNIKDENGK